MGLSGRIEFDDRQYVQSMESGEKGSSENIWAIDNSLGKIIRINQLLFHG